MVLSRYDPAVIDTFLDDPEAIRVDPKVLDATPSRLILASLLDLVEVMG